MREFEKKRQIKKFIYSKAVIALLLIVLFLLAKGTIGVYKKASESASRENLSAVKLSKLEDRKSSLESEIDRLESRVGIEEELRTRYSFSKEGEKIIVIVNEEPPVVENHDENEGGFIKKTFSWFKGLSLVE